MPGQERLRFNIQKIRGHGHKFARHVEINLFHSLYALHILVEHKGDRYIVNIDFVFGNELEQQVKRTLKHFQLEYGLVHTPPPYIRRMARMIHSPSSINV